MTGPHEPDDEPGAQPERDDTGSGALRPRASEPVVEARRGRPVRAFTAPSLTRRAWAKLRAAGGLLVLVVVSGIALAAVIGLAVLAAAFALRQAAGG